MISNTLRRYSALLGFLLVICLALQIAYTSYLFLIHQPSELNEVHQENLYKDPRKQMIGYWGINLDFGFYNGFLRPWILIPLPAFNIYSDVLDKAETNFENRFVGGYGEVWGHLATMKVHGTIEFAGILLMTIAGVLFLFLIFGLIWLVFWSLACKIIRLRGKADPHTVKLAEKMKKWLRESTGDLPILLLVSIFLIFIAGFIEAYISWPVLLPIFTGHLEFSIAYFAFLFVFLTWLFFLKLGGYGQVKKCLR